MSAKLTLSQLSSQGSTFLAISSKELAALPVPCIELVAQRRIGNILSTVDEAIGQTEALVAKLQQMKAGLMHDLFTRGVTRDGRLRSTYAEARNAYKESTLGWIPNDWVVKPLSRNVLTPTRTATRQTPPIRPSATRQAALDP